MLFEESTSSFCSESEDERLSDEIQVIEVEDKLSPKNIHSDSSTSDSDTQSQRKNVSRPCIKRGISSILLPEDLADLNEEDIFEAPFKNKSDPNGFAEYRALQLEKLNSKEAEKNEITNNKSLLLKKRKKPEISSKKQSSKKSKKSTKPKKWWESDPIEESDETTSGSTTQIDSSENDSPKRRSQRIKKLKKSKKKPASSQDTKEFTTAVDDDDDDDDIQLSQSALKRISAARRNLVLMSDTIPMPEFSASLGSDDEIIAITVDLDRIEQIKIRCKGEIMSFPMKRTTPFCETFQKIAQLYNASAAEVMLCVKDRTIGVDDTPNSLNLSPAEILDCCFWARSSVEESSKNIVKMKIQSNDSKTKTNISVHKLEPFSKVMEQYSLERKISLKKMIFEFDGEKINPNDTAVDLDIEDECCIDVKIL